MQTALDLADSGFKVHLIQKDSSLGGTMVMLDKTFPTGDCSMCMISPKMVSVKVSDIVLVPSSAVTLMSIIPWLPFGGVPSNVRLALSKCNHDGRTELSLRVAV
ncbi:hypothetical protein QUF70_19285 [Desulfobacterales bacterium HSG17]|nr:hypothetical protein [Desulfobacterales bacterium HSG17]